MSPQKRKILSVAVFLVGFIVFFFVANQARSQYLGGGTGTLTSLEQFRATTSPVSGITQSVYGKSLIFTGITTGLCLTLNSNHVLTTTSCGGSSASTTALSDSNTWSGTLNSFLNTIKVSTLTGLIAGNNGTLYQTATTTLTAGTNVSFSGGTPVILGSSPVTINATGGSGSGTISTSTTPSRGGLAYWTSSGAFPETLGTVATTTATCTGIVSCTGFTVIGTSPITINASAGSSASSTLLGDTNTFSGTDIFSNTIKVASLSGLIGGNAGTLYAFASSSLFGYIPVQSVTASAPLFSSGGVNPNLTWFGLSTTSALTQGQVLYNTTGGNGVASVGTSTPTVSAPITYSGTLGNFIGGIAGAFGCTNASSGVTGCLTGTDWNTFNNKIGWGQATSTSPNQFVYTNNNGLLISVASSSLNLPNTALANSAITINGSSVSLGGSITVSSTTLLANSNTFGGTQTFTNAPIFSSLTGILKGNGAGALTVASNGTDYSLISALTCSAGSHFSGVTASGTFTCSADTGSGGTGLSTTSPVSAGDLLYYSSGGAGSATGVATTSASCSGTVSCTAFTVLGSSPITITGSASGSFPFTATTNFGGVVYATSTPSLWFQAGTYASSTSYMDNLAIGSTTGVAYANAPIIIGGNFNGTVQAVIQNKSTGNNASGNFVVSDDRGTDSTYYGEFGINNSGYSQAPFASQNAGDVFLNANDGALVIGTASTTNSLADLRFTTGGTASSSIRMIIRRGGLIGIGTTTPVLGALTIATTTAPQEVWSSGAGFSSWAVRNSFGTLYFATTSITAPNATSTASALSINTNSVVNFSVRPTITGGTNSGTGGFAFVTSPTIATPTFTTSAVSPILIGGSAVGATLNLKATSGAGVGAESILFTLGNNGAITSATMKLSGIGIGTTTPQWPLQIASSTKAQLALSDGSLTSSIFAMRNAGGNFYLATASPSTFATSTNSIFSIITGGFSGLFGFGTTSPFYPVTVDNGSIHVAQNKPATSTSMTLSGTTANDFVLRMGTASYTVTITNMRPGQKMTVDTCNPSSTGGAVTWSGVQWDSGTVPTQVTTANKCQTWYFRGTFGTSTPLIVGYPASSGF